MQPGDNYRVAASPERRLVHGIAEHPSVQSTLITKFKARVSR